VSASPYHVVTLGWLAMSLVVFVVLLLRPAPYGRHERGRWGPHLPASWGWLIMETPAVLVIGALALPLLMRDGYAQGWLLLGLWQLHYLQRAFVFPLRLGAARPMPVAVVAMGAGFNVMNGWLNARGITVDGPELGRVALGHPRVVLGSLLFLAGMLINQWADAQLLALRRRSSGYAIPRGGLYERVSCPNYLGEIIEWLGFAIAAGSLAALGFFVWSFANLAPRAVANHRWYRERFPDYPPSRRALIPWIW
jgi:3-oxo-5-alpha-steroid 4-dehydrogenase 1